MSAHTVFICSTCLSEGGFCCERCKLICYCSEACQATDWPIHRRICCTPLRQNDHVTQEILRKHNEMQLVSSGVYRQGQTVWEDALAEDPSGQEILEVLFKVRPGVVNCVKASAAKRNEMLTTQAQKVLGQLFVCLTKEPKTRDRDYLLVNNNIVYFAPLGENADLAFEHVRALVAGIKVTLRRMDAEPVRSKMVGLRRPTPIDVPKQ
jgi:hypothetical protein